MLAGGLDPIYRDMLARSHRPYTRVEVWLGGVRQAVMRAARQDEDNPTGLVYLPGSTLEATLGSQVTRNVALIVPQDLYPYGERDLLAPYGAELRIWAGILPEDRSRSYIWPAFRGKIQDAEADDETGVCTIQAADRAQDVADAGFVNPQNAVAGALLVPEFQRLVTGAVPDAEFGVSDQFDQTMAALAWEFNRSSALEEVFTSVGANWYTLAGGEFVVRKYQWAQASDPVILLSDAEGGVILNSRPARSRRKLWNSITATGERLNGDVPVTATRQDTNPNSVTYIGGNFGIRSKLLRRQTPSTQGGAAAAAEAELRTTISPTQEWSWTQPVDAAVELGDVAGLDVMRGHGVKGIVQVISAFSMPLDQQGRMTVAGRSLVVGQVEAGI